jgi:hypothetical protein
MEEFAFTSKLGLVFFHHPKLSTAQFEYEM